MKLRAPLVSIPEVLAAPAETRLNSFPAGVLSYC